MVYGCFKEIRLGSKVSDLADPTDGAGIELRSFRLYQTYYVGQEKADRICEKLYQRVYKQINDGSLGEAKPLLIRYTEELNEKPGEKRSWLDRRDYIVVTRNTPRDTKATVFMRFRTYGEYLYLGIDAYILGKVRWGAVLRKIFISLTLLIAFFLLQDALKGIFGFGYSDGYGSNPVVTQQYCYGYFLGGGIIAFWWI